MKKLPLLGFDTETTGPDPWHGDKPFAFSFCNEAGETHYVEFTVNPKTREPIPRARPIRWMRRVLENPDTAKVIHNAKFDVRMMEMAYDIRIPREFGQLHDPMFAMHALNSREPKLKLKLLCEKYLGYGVDDERELQKIVLSARRIAKKLGWKIGTRKVKHADGTIAHEALVATDYWLPRTLCKLKPELVGEERLANWYRICKRYAVRDAERHILLFLFAWHGMHDEDSKGTLVVYENELRLWPVTYAMEERGIRVDPVLTRQEIKRIQEQFEDNKAIVTKAARRKDFDIEKNTHISELVLNRLRLVPTERTAKTKRPRVDANFMIKKKEHPIIHALLLYRRARKGLGSYLYHYMMDAVEDHVQPGALCLHPGFRQVGPATRRYSCANPNMQNLTDTKASRGLEPVHARASFGPRDGYEWICADFDNMEVRIFASRSGDERLLDILRSGVNFHSATADQIYGGRDNPKAIEATIHALEFDGAGIHDHHVRAAWKELGWKPPKTYTISPEKAHAYARQWLEKYEWSIAAAEAGLGKKISRGKAKNVFFAKIFGGGANAVMTFLDCSENKAREFMHDYDVVFPRITEYTSEVVAEVREFGYIYSSQGWRINVNRGKPYQGVNYGVQGSAAIHMKIKMQQVFQYLKDLGEDIHLVLMIHDELIFEAKLGVRRPEIINRIRSIMESHDGCFQIDLPVEFDLVPVRWDQHVKMEV